MADDKEKQFSRRDFLKTTGTATGGIIGGSLLGGLVGFNLESADTEGVSADTEGDSATSESENNTQAFEARMFFKRGEDFEVLSAATERIFPEDEIGPGAIGLGVPYFIDKQLVTPWGMNAFDYMSSPYNEGEVPLTRQDVFITGVRALNAVSNEEHDTSFDGLEVNQQISILEQCENNEIEMEYINSSTFFTLLRQATLEGVYSDPLYGGNKNMDGWRMIEYPGAQLSFRNMMEEDSPADEAFTVIEPISLSDQ